MICHGPCKKDKAVCLFAPTEMSKNSPICIQCRKGMYKKQRERTYGKANGNGHETWRKNMRAHFCK